jgi:methylated-DNA-[protein]-cysteine S-methyltransferase
MSETTYTVVPSPVGDLVVTGDGTSITGIGFASRTPVRPGWRRDDGAHEDAARQLREYFAGERTGFELPLAPEGTDFQRRVWAALAAIPYGETTSYAALPSGSAGPGAPGPSGRPTAPTRSPSSSRATGSWAPTGR